MATPITFSGFNQIDFNVILNAVMTQESQPLVALQTQQTTLQTTNSNYGLLASKLDALSTATDALSKQSSLVTYAAASSDSNAVGVSASSSAVAGSYDVVVNALAASQISVTTSTAADANTTIVATGGTITIGSATISVSGPVTLQGLRDTINADPNSPAAASIVQTAPGAYRLVLTGKSSGASNSFTIQSALTGSTVAFADFDNDGTSGDTASDVTVQASDASLLVNNIAITSTSNSVQDAVPGVTLTLRQKDPTKTVAVTVAQDNDAVADRVQTFINAFNDLVKFADDQAAAAKSGKAGTLANDPVLKSVRNELRTALSAVHGTGAFKTLAEVGIGFTRTGQLTLDKTALITSLESDPASVNDLFANSTTGAFKAMGTLIDDYTSAGGFVFSAKSRISDELSRLGRRIDDFTVRLAQRRAALQKEYTAADLAMTRLNAQKSALASFGADLSTSQGA